MSFERRPLMERFLSKISPEPNTGCWLWTGALSGSGYPCMLIGGRRGGPKGGHRIAYELLRGPITEGLFVLHRCDNPVCVNPDHLWLGSHQENMIDKAEKGRVRSVAGERNPNAKLTAPQVREIRRRLVNGEKIEFLAREYGVSHFPIRMIAYGRTWRSI